MTPVRNFRDDINGLRAWAVVAVILFHFGIPGFDGGFVGVDVFFVISGFLMTGIIIKGLETTGQDGRHGFSLIGFYLSRGRRIIPALAVLCAVLLLAGWLFLPFIEYRQLGSHAAAALGFLSNVKFWMEAGYFDVASHEKWLLHTWSLSVEWQFYMLLPIVLMLVWKMVPGRRAATIVIASILGASFFLSVATSSSSPSAAFFLLPTRAWEMMAGGLVFIAGSRVANDSWLATVAYYTGFMLIVISIAAFDSSSTWPGSNALLPVLGTSLVLLSARQRGILTGSTALQRLGDWSYSLYLWHWPFAVALVYFDAVGSMGALAGALIATFVAGWLSYSLVETPFRRSRTLSSSASLTVLAGVVLAVSLPAASIYAKNGVPGRLDPEIEAIFLEAQNFNPRRTECHTSKGEVAQTCLFGGDTLGAVVVGDSHAASIISAVEKSLPKPELHVLAMTLSDCPTIEGVTRIGDSTLNCKKAVQSIFAQLDEIPKDVPVILSNRYSAAFLGRNEDSPEVSSLPIHYISAPYPLRTEQYFDEIKGGYISSLCKIAENRELFVLGPIPELAVNVPNVMGRKALQGVKHRVSVDLESYLTRNSLALETLIAASNKCNITVLDPVPFLCNDEACYGDTGGQPIYFDDDHLSERGAELLIPLFGSVFKLP